MITRNEIPILEYDDSSSEVIPPDHDWAAGRLPEKCLFAFLGDVIHKYAKAHDSDIAETLITVSYDILHWKGLVASGDYVRNLKSGDAFSNGYLTNRADQKRSERIIRQFQKDRKPSIYAGSRALRRSKTTSQKHPQNLLLSEGSEVRILSWTSRK